MHLRLAAVVALIACLATTFLGGWHAVAHASHPAPATTLASGDDPAGVPAADIDCAYHCDQHGRGVPAPAPAEAVVATDGEPLLPARSAMAEPRTPETPLEPPRS